ncbi:MAG: hypothetical protein QOK36_367 [Gaiellales bacterium]|jgi:hypothetical protein|nr:hypothetical protein [Gaiellales bacterium]
MAARDDPDDIEAIESVPDDIDVDDVDEDDIGNSRPRDPGIDRHDFAGEWESVWQDVGTDPTESLPNLEDIVRRLLELHGYVLDSDDPAARGEEVEVLAPYWSARELADAVRDGEDVDGGDVAQAIADLSEIYESLIERIEGNAR